MKLLVDTDVLIWHLRGYSQATRRLDQLPSLTLCAVSYLEILQGMRNKAELLAVKKMLDQRQALLFELTPAITQRTTALMESWTFSHGIGFADALIAATALEHDMSILTANTQHFKSVPGLKIEVFEV